MMLEQLPRSLAISFLLVLLPACALAAENEKPPADPVRLVTLDPGHFHAALVQKVMYEGVSPVVSVYAPDGPDVTDHLLRIQGFNTRSGDPTGWIENVYRGPEFLDRMFAERPGNVVVISGNNRKKAEYIRDCVAAGLNVFADKPMCIDGNGYVLLREAFALAAENGALLYDIMTERSEVTSVLQRELASDPAVFGRLLPGSAGNPAVIKESVHHFFKLVAGAPVKRPAWFFDTTQQGEGIVDVTTHLIDLIFWGCFPDQALRFPEDIVLTGARRWPTLITREQFEQATRCPEFPDDLAEELNADGELPCFANGEIAFTVKGVHARAAVRWNFQAPEGGKDTHFSVMRGSTADLVVRQGEEQGYRPELYVNPAAGADRDELELALMVAVVRLQSRFPGLGLEAIGDGWRVVIPERFRVGHEAHFGEVTERYLRFLEQGELPDWEVPNMLAKYALTTAALERCRAGEPADAPPAGAVVLFDGTDFANWTTASGEPVGWTIADSAMRIEPGAGSIQTRADFHDFRLHLEFNIPESPPQATLLPRDNRGNSGVYLQRRYEVQILDSFGHEPEIWDCGALYRFRAPDRNASRPAGQWQTYDITFRAPRYQGGGADARKTENARVSVTHNGILIHDDVELSRKTGQGLAEGPAAGPVLLQDHGTAIRFRNVWIVPLDS